MLNIGEVAREDELNNCQSFCRLWESCHRCWWVLPDHSIELAFNVVFPWHISGWLELWIQVSKVCSCTTTYLSILLVKEVLVGNCEWHSSTYLCAVWVLFVRSRVTWIKPRGSDAESSGKSMLHFIRNCQAVFWSGGNVFLSYHQWRRIPCPLQNLVFSGLGTLAIPIVL